ncbi:hypothetical protein Dimus_024394, partial [Dionaea muscipula]
MAAWHACPECLPESVLGPAHGSVSSRIFSTWTPTRRHPQLSSTSQPLHLTGMLALTCS